MTFWVWDKINYGDWPDLALKLLKSDRQLALTHHVQHGTALHMLARNPSPFADTGGGLPKSLINSSN